MKAIVYRKYGPPDVLHLEEIDKPTPKANELLIRVHAAEATKSDCEMRSFNFSVKWFVLPLRLAMGVFTPRYKVLGGYFAGEVVALGRDVTRFSVGDRIFGCTGFTLGAYSEFLCLREDKTLAHIPANVSFAEAAAVPLGGLNGLYFMRKAHIQPGDKVLINGAGGSIGLFAVQIAKSMGAEVTAVDSDIKQEFLSNIGADHVMDYAKQDFTKTGQTYDVIFDMVVSSSYGDCIRILNPGGRYLTGNPRLSVMFRTMLTNRFSDKSASFAFAGETDEELQTLAVMLQDGRIKSAVDQIFPMEQAAKAHELVETEARVGTIVIAMA